MAGVRSVVFKTIIAKGETAADLVAAAHIARKQAKLERQAMADALVDLLIENAHLRASLRERRGV